MNEHIEKASVANVGRTRLVCFTYGLVGGRVWWMGTTNLEKLQNSVHSLHYSVF